MKRDQAAIILVTRFGLSNLTISDAPYSIWIHVEALTKIDMRHVVEKHYKNCVHFAVSGNRPEVVHDAIDDCLVDLEVSDTPTTWHHESLKEMAWNFPNIDFSQKTSDIKVVAVLGESMESELCRISEISQYIADLVEMYD
ncbi:hypothetical protein [Brevundimonas sp. A19_0]|uniref:hypothetical protein n=1 Tax=Brevundimonas sp. A19_0 TaxID=2821087 RepID=UPI001ADB41D3|nr:hypothetical protein [Brevundimonas sp. A19_0]MBO9501194.1 hypothetical protein [Brevundimonas sp. A19_0]